MLTADDFILADTENYLPANAKDIESAFNYIMHRSIAISPQDAATLAVVLSRNIKWGTNNANGEVYAAALPVKDVNNLFVSGNVEDVLKEIAGTGRTTETLKGLADTIAITFNHIDATIDDENIVHGLKIIDDLDYPVD
jgi:hypothetical protein